MQSSPNMHPELVERVREGMDVVGPDGSRLGTVKYVKMGDPQAVTTRGNAGLFQGPGLIGSPGDERGVLDANDLPGWSTGEPHVPDPLRTRLMRVGYIEVDGPDLGGDRRYIAADRVEAVDLDTVRLGPEVAQPAPRPIAEQPDLASPDGRTVRVVETESEPEGRPAAWSTWPIAIAAAGAGAGAAAWWYLRWRRERNRPVNRLRRTARELAKRLPEREALAEYLPEDNRARAGGALLTMLVVRWLLSRGGEKSTEESEERQQVTGTTPADVLQAIQMDSWRRSPRRAPAGLLAGVVVGLGILAWRLTRRRETTVSIGTPGVQSASGRDRTLTGELPLRMRSEHGHPL